MMDEISKIKKIKMDEIEEAYAFYKASPPVMANLLHTRRRRRHHRDSPGTIGLQEAARLRDRTLKDRERMSRNKRRRADGVDESSEESVNDDVDDGGGSGGRIGVSYQLTQDHMTSSPVAGSFTSQRKSGGGSGGRIGVSYQLSQVHMTSSPPTKVYRVTPSWKATDEMIGIPRKARSASAKRSHKWSSSGVLDSSSPVQSDMAAAAEELAVGTSSTPRVPSPSPSSAPMSNKPNGVTHRPPKPASKSSPSPSPSVQDEIEIEVAEVLYGLMRQTQPPAPPPIESTPRPHESNSTAPKRKRPRLHPDEGQRSNPVSKSQEQEIPVTNNNGGSSVSKKMDKGRNEMVWSAGKVDEVVSSSSPMLDSSSNLHRVHSSSTSAKPNSSPVEQENRRGDKLQIDLMAPASPEKEEEAGKYGEGEVRDENSMVTDRDRETSIYGSSIHIQSKTNKVEDHESLKIDSETGVGVGGGGGCAESSRVPGGSGGDETKSTTKGGPHQHKAKLSLSSPPPPPQRESSSKSSLKLDLEKTGVNNNENNKLNNFQQQQQQQLPKNCVKDGSKSGGQQPGCSGPGPFPMSVPSGWHGGLPPMGYVGPMQGVVSMDGTTMAPPPIQPTPPPPHFLLSQPKPKRCATHCHVARSIMAHQQMMKISPFWPPVAPPPLFGAKPSADLHAAKGGGAAQDCKTQALAFFPGHGQPLGNKSPLAGSVPESAQKKQMLLQPGLPPGAPGNMMHASAMFFPMGQQQAAASARPGSGKSPSMASGAASTSALTSAPMGGVVSSAAPAMSFSYPNMNGNETQFMAILGNGPYPFPIPAHVGAAPPYRGSHPQGMPFFNGSFYPSQMLHPSQLQQNHQNASVSTSAPSSQKHLQSQQQRSQGSSPTVGNQNQNPSMQNLQAAKSRDIGGEGSPSATADSRNSNRSNMSVYGPNFVMPFHSPNFALMPSIPNGNHGDKKHQQQQQSQQAAFSAPFPMSFATINGANTPGLDISSMSQNHAFLQGLPDAAKYSYQMMAAAQAAVQHSKSDFRGPENGKHGAGPTNDHPSSLDDERRAMASRASVSSVGQSIAFSRDSADNVGDSSARSLNLKQQQQQQQQQQQSQMLFSKPQQYTPPNAANPRSKTSSTSNGNVYPDHLTSSTIMAAKFPSNLSGFPTPSSQPQWKNSVRPNTSQISSPPCITSTSAPSTVKNISQQQGRPQQSQTHISFGASQGQQTQAHNSIQAPVGSPSNSSISKSAGGSPRTSQQGKNSPSPSLSTQKPSILGSSPNIMSTSGASGKPQSQQPPQQQQLSKQSIQQAQLYFSNYMQANTSAAMVGTGYYLQRQQQQHPQQQQQQQQGPKSQGSNPPTSSSAMLSLSTPVSFANAITSDSSKAKVGLLGQGIFNGVQSGQLLPASFPYLNPVSSTVPVKPTEQKQPAGE